MNMIGPRDKFHNIVCGGKSDLLWTATTFLLLLCLGSFVCCSLGSSGDVDCAFLLLSAELLTEEGRSGRASVGSSLSISNDLPANINHPSTRPLNYYERQQAP